MNREIEFRGKRIDNGEWAYGSFLQLEYAKTYTYIVDRYGTIEVDNIEGVQEVIPETVGQYTGIKDKNGKKIFEHDIVRAGLREYIVCFGLHGIPCCGCCYSFHNSIGFYLKNIETNTIESDEETFTEYQGLEVIGTVFDKEATMGIKKCPFAKKYGVDLGKE